MTLQEFKLECTKGAAVCNRHTGEQDTLCRNYAVTFLIFSIETSLIAIFFPQLAFCTTPLSIFCFCFALHALKERRRRVAVWLKLRQEYLDMKTMHDE